MAERAAVLYLTSDAVDDITDLCHSLRLLRLNFLQVQGLGPRVENLGQVTW